MILARRFFDYPSAYGSFNDIPDDMKLRSFETEIDGNDAIQDYVSFYLDKKQPLEETENRLKRAMLNWKKHCRRRGCNPILAPPETVDVWCDKLHNYLNTNSIKHGYLAYLNRLYRYLMWHVDYPHCYNPVQFAVREYSAAKTAWNVGGDD